MAAVAQKGRTVSVCVFVHPLYIHLSAKKLAKFPQDGPRKWLQSQKSAEQYLFVCTILYIHPLYIHLSAYKLFKFPQDGPRIQLQSQKRAGQYTFVCMSI